MIAKSSGLYVATFAVWLIAVCVGVPSLVHGGLPSDEYSSSFHYLGAIVLAYFWFYSSYDLCSFMLYYRNSRKQQQVRHTTQLGGSEPEVAVLYTVCNDFVNESALRNLELGSSNCRLFICDDSTHEAFKGAIDRLLAANPGRYTLLRRDNRAGYKAGNLNHALKYLDARYRFVLLADTDSEIHPDFIPVALDYFRDDDKLAFVQARHATNPNGSWHGFQAAIALGVEVLWRGLSLKDGYGFTPLVGHGAMIRVQALRDVGGFPHRVSEDLCLTTALRKRGYYGRVESETTCYESPPQTLAQFRRRWEKWLIGGVEFLRHDAVGFAQAQSVPAVEKVDLFFHLCALFNIVVLGAFLAVINVAWPLACGVWTQTRIDVPWLNVGIRVPFLVWHMSSAEPGSIGARLVIVGAILAPLLYLGPDLRR